MRYFLILVFTTGQFACNDKKIAANPDKIDTLKLITESNLTHSTADKAVNSDIDTLTEIEFVNLFHKKLRIKYDLRNDKTLEENFEKSHDFWRGKKLLLNDSLKTIIIQGYPLAIKEKGNQLKWMITLGEGENQKQIRLFTLDKFYNIVDNAILSSYGGDEGVRSWTLGQFKNDSTYSITTFLTGYETDSIESKSISCLTIQSNGEIRREENCR